VATTQKIENETVAESNVSLPVWVRKDLKGPSLT
jgi:hypothetical protein